MTDAGNEFTGDAENVVQVGAVHGSLNLGAGRRDRPVPRQLPLSVAGFVNRADTLNELNDMLDSGLRREAVVVSAVAGAPGVGKTALAVRWAHHVRSRFPDGDLYVDMRGYGPGPPLGADQALDGFLRALNVSVDGIPEELSERSSLYRSVLDGKRILVLVDNVSSSAEARPLLPGAGGCFALITSRSTLSGLVTREGAARVTLDVLSPSESVELLGQVIGSARTAAEPQAALRVAELCGFLPLALRVVAERAADRPGLPLTELIDELLEEQHRLDALASTEDELSDVRAAFSWSYSALSAELQRAFRLLGLHAGAEIGLGAVAALIDEDHRTTARNMRELSAVHLVQEISVGRYRLHDLLRTYAREKLSAEEGRQQQTQAVRRMLSWYLLATDSGRRVILPYSHAVPLVPASNMTVPSFEDARDAMRWFDQERPNLLAALDQAAEVGQYDIAWKLPVVTDGFFELRSYWADWESIHRVGVEAAVALGDKLGEASNIFALGDSDWRAGRTDAAAANYRRAVELSREIGDPWVQGFALRGLGLIHEDSQDISTSSAFFRSALAVFRAGEIRRGEGMALLSLSRCAMASDNIGEAVSLGKSAVEIFVELQDEWSEAWGALPLAAALTALGRAAETVARLRHAIEVFERFQDHRSSAMALAALGDALHQIGDIAEAVASWRRAADIYESLGDERAGELRVRLQSADAE